MHDLTDISVVRSWLNNPLSSSLATDIYKATNIVRSFAQASCTERVLLDLVWGLYWARSVLYCVALVQILTRPMAARPYACCAFSKAAVAFWPVWPVQH